MFRSDEIYSNIFRITRLKYLANAMMYIIMFESFSFSNGMEDLFYFLGDFYFKNKEFGKALKFYTHDVCVNPDRFQSWAAMAFTRASRLEQKFNQVSEYAV